MINWAYFPQSERPTQSVEDLINLFKKHSADIDSALHEKQVSNDVLNKLTDSLEEIGFKVERGKKKLDKISIPVLFGKNGKVVKSFEADAYNAARKVVLEVEAGRGVVNHQFLKDLFQACMMPGVEYLAIAIRNTYRKNNDFDNVFTFFDTLYKSNRMQLPLKGILIIGY